jgi:tetratricopeptide (TPR) repeat protein
MPRSQDLHGLPLTTDSTAAAEAFNRTTLSYLKYRTDLADHLAATLKADPNFALGHCAKGYFTLLSYKQANVPIAVEAHRTASALAAGATQREQAHVGALGAWIEGDVDRALGLWEEILAAHPTDAFAMRLAHFINFWLGRPQAMRASIERVLPRWPPELPGYSVALGCEAFALEECGDYGPAERAGRRAVEIDPADVWGTHAVAHVLEMQGRTEEGIAWLERLAPNWGNANNLVHHLWWHRAMFHLERREFDAVLALYDERFRNLSAPLTIAQPDLYIDVQNAASMLFRLERHGIAVGDRWVEIADKAEARIGDCLSAFTLPHWVMALAATGRAPAVQRMLAAMRDFHAAGGTLERVVRTIAVPICEAVLAHRRSDYAGAVERMHPVLERMFELGGSHAQQDVLEQLYLDSAVKAGRTDDVRALLRRVAARHPVPPARRVGYAAAAGAFH